jgi:prephenate dehydratase
MKPNSTISIQGKLASFSHIAAQDIFGKNISLLERDNFDDVFEDIANDSAEYAVVPIENSTYGSIYTNYDRLTKHDFRIVGEIYLKINFHLIANLGTKFEDITDAYIHPVAMGQIQSFIDKNPQIKFHEHEDTAGAVKMIKDKKMMNAMGAASKFAAEYYEMKILQENIHENPKNYTRFFILSKNYQPIGDTPNKTTIQFVLGEEAGSLYKTLRAFADRNISLTKIESRPIINTDWEYRFYVDAMANELEDSMQNSMREIQDYVKELKVLGTYEKGKYLET